MTRIIPALFAAVLLTLALPGCRAAETADAASIAAIEGSESASDAAATETVPPAEDTQPPDESPAPEDEPQPDNSWETDAPENHGVNPGTLKSLHEAVADVDIYSVVTVRDGVLIDEYYKDDYDESSVFRLASCSKSFTGALTGLAIDQGLLSGVDATLEELFPQVAESDEALNKQVTVAHLLTHSSGIEWYEWGGNSSSWRPFQQAENWVDHILSQRMTSQPGTTFAYSTGGSHLLAAILQEATGKSAYEYGLEHVFAPMGMDSVTWAADDQGITDGGNGIAMTARDAAKFGQLYLDGGRWRGRQILPEAWVEESVRTQFARSGNSGSYGYQWWLRDFGGYETYYAMGHGGQYIFVVPELRLVTVITSRFSDTYAPWTYFTDYILAACAPQQETEE